jgi:hypothetical protein
MGIKKYLEKHIRGWLPKEPNLPSNKVKMADAKTKAPKPRWWRPLWIVTVLGTIVSGLVSFLIFNVPLERAIALLFFAFGCLGFAYYIRVRPSIKVNRAVYILLGISPIGFCLSLAWNFTIGRYTTPWLGIWGFFIGLIVPCTIGAFIGDWIGKRRNYQLPLSP